MDMLLLLMLLLQLPLLLCCDSATAALHVLDEHMRTPQPIKAIVCSVAETCKCVDSSKCELDWCVPYLFEWRKDFGACVKKGC